MRVLLIGATGRVGRPVLRELLARGHAVTALARDPSTLARESEAIEVLAGDAFADGVIAGALPGHDVLVSSVALRDSGQQGRTPLELTRALGIAAASAGVRWISLGGAGSLRVADGTDLVDTPEFPAVAAGESRGFRDALHELLAHAPSELVWTVVSPPAAIEFDAARTGAYRTAADDLLLDADGRSWLSVADLAVAVVDEVETGAHPRQRFAVAH